jgi:circadian clock protein KaiC
MSPSRTPLSSWSRWPPPSGGTWSPPRPAGPLPTPHTLDELDLDILTSRIAAELAKGQIRRVVIDSLAEMASAAREAERFSAFARSLTGMIRAAGATLVLTSETTTLGPSPEPVSEVMFLFHNLVLLRYIEQHSAARRALNIIKMRNSHHSEDVHQFTISKDGLTVGDKLQDVTGVLGWSALRTNDTPQLALADR